MCLQQLLNYFNETMTSNRFSERRWFPKSKVWDIIQQPWNTRGNKWNTSISKSGCDIQLLQTKRPKMFRKGNRHCSSFYHIHLIINHVRIKHEVSNNQEVHTKWLCRMKTNIYITVVVWPLSSWDCCQKVAEMLNGTYSSFTQLFAVYETLETDSGWKGFSLVS